MPNNYGLGPRPVPLQVKTVQPGSVHSSGQDLGIVQATESLWWGGTSSKHSYGFPDPDAAPTCTLTAVDTAVTFTIGDSSDPPAAAWSPPWFIHPVASRIQMLVVFAMRSDESTIQARSGTFQLDGSNSSVGQWDTLAYSNGTPATGLWGQSETPWRLVRAILENTPTPDANGFLQIRFQCQYVSATGNEPYNVGTNSRIVKVHSARFQDLMDRPAPSVG